VLVHGGQQCGHGGRSSEPRITQLVHDAGQPALCVVIGDVVEEACHGRGG
jgi:hypothetical protein